MRGVTSAQESLFLHYLIFCALYAQYQTGCAPNLFGNKGANLRFDRQRIKHRSEHILRSTRNMLLSPTPTDFAAVVQSISLYGLLFVIHVIPDRMIK